MKNQKQHGTYFTLCYDKTMYAYHYAIAHDFRFYSYGDAMFVEREAAG